MSATLLHSSERSIDRFLIFAFEIIIVAVVVVVDDTIFVFEIERETTLFSSTHTHACYH